MAITAKEIEEKGFKPRLRGYDIQEVDEFMDQVAAEVTALLQTKQELEEKVAAYAEKEARMKELESTLHETLITAQRAAEDVISTSRERAAALLAEAEQQSAQMLSDANAQVNAARGRLDGINRDAAGVKAMIRKVLNDQLTLLDQSYPDAAMRPVETVREAAPLAFDLNQTQEFSARDVREAAGEEEYPYSRHRRILD